MSRIYESLRKVEDNRQMQIGKDIPLRDLVESDPPDEETVPLSPLFLVETLRDIKKNAGSIYKIGLLSIEKSDDREEREHSRTVITKAYHQIVSTVNMLSSYINVTSPILKKNTIHCILEEILESNEKKLRARKIDLKKALDEELPETLFHDEQLRFVLNSVLQYAILSTPSGRSIEIVTRCVNHEIDQDLFSDDPLKSKYSEVLISFSCLKYSSNEPLGAPAVPRIERDGTSDFILRLVREMIRRNQGMVDFQMDQTESRTRISLRFPVERRRMVYYRPAHL